MTDEQKAAYIHAQAVCTQLEMEGMLATNRMREMLGQALAYPGEEFMAVMEKYVICHNDVIGLFHGG